MLIRLTAPYIVVRRLKLGPVGRPGRGKREDENLWHETVRFAVDTGAMFRPSEEFEFVMDDFCVHSKRSTAQRRRPRPCVVPLARCAWRFIAASRR